MYHKHNHNQLKTYDKTRAKRGTSILLQHKNIKGKDQNIKNKTQNYHKYHKMKTTFHSHPCLI